MIKITQGIESSISSKFITSRESTEINHKNSFIVEQNGRLKTSGKYVTTPWYKCYSKASNTLAFLKSTGT